MVVSQKTTIACAVWALGLRLGQETCRSLQGIDFVFCKFAAGLLCCRVAVGELNLSYYIGATLSGTIYPHYGHLT